MSKIRWILFDLGNVLYDIDVNSVLKRLHNKKHLKDEDLELETVHSLHLSFMAGEFEPEQFLLDLKNRFKLNLEPSEIKDIWNKIIVGFRTEFEPVLQKLKLNYNLGVLSNTDPIHFEKILQQKADFDRYFDKLFFSYQLKYIKPDPKIFNLVIDDLKVQPSSIIFFDDAQANVDTAKSLGMNAFCVDNLDSVLTILKEYHIFVNVNKTN